MDDTPARTTPRSQPPPPPPPPPTTVQVEINNLPAPTERRTKARRKLQQYEPLQAGGKGRLGKKKCRERELLKLAYWKINLPK
jgi:hypothetical protein